MPPELWHWIMVASGALALMMGLGMRATAAQLLDDNPRSEIDPYVPQPTQPERRVNTPWDGTIVPPPQPTPKPTAVPVPVPVSAHSTPASPPIPPQRVEVEHAPPTPPIIVAPVPTAPPIVVVNEATKSEAVTPEASSAQAGGTISKLVEQSEEAKSDSSSVIALPMRDYSQTEQRFIGLLEKGLCTDAFGMVARGTLGKSDAPATHELVKELCGQASGPQVKPIWPLNGDSFNPEQHATVAQVQPGYAYVIDKLITLGWSVDGDVVKAQVTLDPRARPATTNSGSLPPDVEASAINISIHSETEALDKVDVQAVGHPDIVSAPPNLVTETPAETGTNDVSPVIEVMEPTPERPEPSTARIISEPDALDHLVSLCRAFEFDSPHDVAGEMLTRAKSGQYGAVSPVSLVQAALEICQSEFQSIFENVEEIHSMPEMEPNIFIKAPFEALINDLDCADQLAIYDLSSRQFSEAEISASIVYRVGKNDLLQATLVPGLRRIEPTNANLSSILLQPIIALG